MTDLLTRPFLRGPSGPGEDQARPVLLAAVAGGAAAAVLSLAVCLVIALAGWFASDAGAYGDTRDALRVGTDAWLLAHGSSIRAGGATVALLPLGLTALCGLCCFRIARRASRRSAGADARTLLTAGLLFAASYAAVAVVAAVLAFHESAQPHLGRGFLGAFGLALVLGGAGLLAGTEAAPRLLGRLPGFWGAALLGAGVLVLVVFAAGALLLGAAFMADFGAAANVLSRLHVDGPDALLYTVLVAAVVPNAAALGAAYLLGPGFAVGAGTTVSPTAVALGPVPAFPLLAALPGDAPTPAWSTALIAVPPLLAAVAVALVHRRLPTPALGVAAARGLAAGVVAAVALALLVALAGGSVGPGRMAVVGASVTDVLPQAVTSLGAGGLVGGLLAGWWGRRR